MTENLRRRCPYCGRGNDGESAVSRTDKPDPKPGDVTICLYCSEIALFSASPDGLTIRKPDDVERAALEADPMLTEARHMVTVMRKDLGVE